MVGFYFRKNTQNTYLFDEQGKLIEWTDANGHKLIYAYSPQGDLERVTDELTGRYIALTYYLQGEPKRLETITDHTTPVTNRHVTFTYYANGDLETVTDMMEQVWKYIYNTNHQLTAIQKVAAPQNLTMMSLEYDEQGRTIKQYNGPVDIANLILELSYQGNNTTLVTQHFDGKSYTRTDVYDYRNTLVSATGIFNDKGYDDNFHPSLVTDPLGNLTFMQWSSAGNLQVVEDANSGQIDMTYDALNHLDYMVDPRNYPTDYVYNGNLLFQVTIPSPKVVE